MSFFVLIGISGFRWKMDFCLCSHLSLIHFIVSVFSLNYKPVPPPPFFFIQTLLFFCKKMQNCCFQLWSDWSAAFIHCNGATSPLFIRSDFRPSAQNLYNSPRIFTQTFPSFWLSNRNLVCCSTVFFCPVLDIEDVRLSNPEKNPFFFLLCILCDL